MQGVQIWKPITVWKEMIGKEVSYHGAVPKETVSVGAEVTSGGRLFHRRLPNRQPVYSIAKDQIYKSVKRK